MRSHPYNGLGYVDATDRQQEIRAMLKITGLGHVGLVARDPIALAAFYRDLFGMEDVGQAPDGDGLGSMAFLSSRRAEENHELVFFQAAQLAHVAFKVGSLAELRASYKEIKARGLPVEMAFDHRSSFAFYFRDPEGHLIEIYWPTGRDATHPVLDPIDLERPEDELLALAATTPARPA